MDAVRQEKPERLREGIDPEGRTSETSVAVGAERKDFAARAAVAGVNVPAQTAPRANSVRRLDAGHQPHRFRLEKANAVQLAEVQQHPGVTGEVRCGGEKTRMTGHAAHVTRRRVVHDT